MSATSTKAHSKRDEIIAIASRLFYEQGFGATGIKQIIDEAGIAKGTFYSHFPSKEALGIAWLKSRHHTWNKWFEDAIAKQESAAHRIIASFDFLATWLKECDYRGCAFINTMAETPDFESPMRKEVMSHKKELHERFRELATNHSDAVGKNDGGSAALGTTLYLLFEGALVESQNFHDSWPIIAARDMALTLLKT
ncbi:TetR/AcrR family transcriptional regulator [Verrucomicrobiales bacterium]|jgi:AcrR family transcriptional regulator|nr:TetR/AcrR family transcriptional regulator [Verrucomicrobiales bacterium]MDA7926979.1 TetR/AcrR family transcriptional regulator [Verrucomicrobiales bacterium]|tara:strand:+ start:274 stop:861 length:588 start_codon:yes stop_codon:yes gene_type:complete